MLYVVFGVLFMLTALVTAAEMATFSARPDRMRQLVDAGDKRGKAVLAYQRSPVSFLAAGQVIATAASLTIGAIMQAQVVPSLSLWLSQFVFVTPRQLDGIAAFLALTIFTVLALILTNVVPKQIGFDHADEVAAAFARPFRFLIRMTRPIAWIVTVTSQLFEKIVNRRVKRSARVTEADILTLVAEGIRIGSLDERETQFVKNALRLSDLLVKNVMTPMHQVDAIDVAWDRERIDREVRRSDRSYLFVYHGSPDSPVGVLRARDWLSSPHRASVEHMLQPIETISSNASAASLFELLQRKEIRMLAVVEDERTIGLVTQNDAVSLLQHGG